MSRAIATTIFARSQPWMRRRTSLCRAWSPVDESSDLIAELFLQHLDRVGSVFHRVVSKAAASVGAVIPRSARIPATATG